MLIALLVTPAPLLPPHRLSELAQSVLGVDWKIAYLAAAVTLQSVFYGSLGVLATMAVTRATTLRGRLLQVCVVPLAVVGMALAIRSMKLGHPPVWSNAAVPVASCLFGVLLGIGLLYRRWKSIMLVVLVLIGALWELVAGGSKQLTTATELRLRHLVAAGSGLPRGEKRFGALLQTVFAPGPTDSADETAVQHNRAAILAWGIAAGDPLLARLVGLDPNAELVRQAAALRQGTTLCGREDWSRHYSLSAALSVLEHPLVSDAGGLMKEQLDALTRDSGFSFGDLAADRAGIRFAEAATTSETAAKTMQGRLLNGFVTDDFFPQHVDYAENLSVEEFRRAFGWVGSRRYHRELTKIENELDSCVALSNVRARRHGD